MVKEDVPIAVRLRPRNLDEFVGQKHILGEGKLLYRIIISRRIPPLILYGPPGTGKTTLGFIISRMVDADFTYVNAAFSSVKEIKSVLEGAKRKLDESGRKTIFFIDEIHRFNKLQQEALIPDTEEGTIIFIGATIYNPRYYLINSLLSRSVVAYFKPLEEDDIKKIIKRALEDKERGLGGLKIEISEDAVNYIVASASGDARKALTSLEVGVLSTAPDKRGVIVFDMEVARQTIQKNIFYDRKDGYHYDTISAFIKSVRGSDPDSALYWLAKMLLSGEDPRFIARRLVILASEDIGNANPFALVLATSCFNAVEFVGMPEAQLILAQTTTYLATSPKSNASYQALSRARADVETRRTREVPSHLKTHSKQYKYPHLYPDSQTGAYVDQGYGAPGRYYFPKPIGDERRILEFMNYLRTHKKNATGRRK